MKNALRILALAALAAVSALPAYAQDAAAPAADPCAATAEPRAALYQQFLASYKGSPEQQKAASLTGKDYISKYGSCQSDADKKVTAFIQNWVKKYDDASRDFNFTKAVNENPAQAFQLSRELLAADPDNLKIHLQLVAAGLKAAQKGDKSVNADTVRVARRALTLIDQGKTTDSWAPYPNQQEAVPGLNYHIGFFTLETAPAEAATHLLKAAQSSSTYSKEPTTYDFLALAYFKNEFQPMAAEYKSKYEGKDATPESEALFNKINAVTARIADTYARAVANTKAADAKALADRRAKLSTFYKQLHDGQETGMNEYVAGILNKPIMLPGQEPAPPAATPSSSANGANGAATTTQPASSTTPAGAKPAASTTTPAAKPAASTATPAAKPAATPTPKPSRSN